MDEIDRAYQSVGKGCRSPSVGETSWHARLRIAGMFKLLISLRRTSWTALDGYIRSEDGIMSSARTPRVTQLIQLPEGKPFNQGRKPSSPRGGDMRSSS